ncbi:MAG: signal peptidase II [Myxococcota bacterium]
MKRKMILSSAVCGVLLALDQVSKHLVMWNLVEGRDAIDVIDGWLMIVHARNIGAAFSILEGQIALFLVFTLGALGILGHMLWQLDDDDWFQALAIGVVGSGVFGNGIDRALYGSVTDLIRIYTDHPALKSWLIDHLGTAAWPTFNIADITLVVGLLMFFAQTLLFPQAADAGLDVSAAHPTKG